MACFLVPAAEAVIITVVAQAFKRKETLNPVHVREGSPVKPYEKSPFYRKLKWLSNLLWGGSGLLAFEHLWHGELVPWFPFLSAASNPADTVVMLHEMATVGVAMAALITAVWVGMLIVAANMEHKKPTAQAAVK